MVIHPRKPSAKVVVRNAPILERIEQLKSEHPFWGYRRIWATLRFAQGLRITRNHVYRLMGQEGLLVDRNRCLKARRSSGRSKPRPTRPNQWWGIDMTKVLSTESGWVQIVLVLDWYTKKIVGHHVGRRAATADWLEALDQGLNLQFPQGSQGQNLHLMSDNGTQPTSTTFLKACGLLGVRQAFTAFNNPKGNADTERMMRTIKEELLWLQEWKDEFEMAQAVEKWIEYYNQSYLHSALDYQSPNQFEGNYNNGPNTLLESA